MPGYGKPTAGETVDAGDAARQLEHPAAPVAVEVVVMRFAGTLVDRGGAREVNGRKPAIFEQGLDVPVNCGDPQALHIRLSRHKDLLRRKRPASPFECFANRCSLPRVPLILFGHVFCLMIARY